MRSFTAIICLTAFFALHHKDTTHHTSTILKERTKEVVLFHESLQSWQAIETAIYENKREKGRVVESPVTSLEKDIMAIVTGKPYEHRYKNAGNPKPATTTDTARLRPAM